MTDLYLALLVGAFLGFALSLANWRVTFLAVIVVGFLQDPLRKMHD